MLLICTQSNLELLKLRVMAELPTTRSGANPFKSSHVTEAIAAALGHSTNASLKAAMSRHDRPWPLLRRLDAEAFVARLARLTPFLRGIERPDRFFGDGLELSRAFEEAWTSYGYSPPGHSARKGCEHPLLVPENHWEGRLVAVAAALGRAYERHRNEGDTLHVRLRHEGGTDFSCEVSDRPNGGPFQVTWTRHAEIRMEVMQGLGDGIRDFADLLAWEGIEGYTEEEAEIGLALSGPPSFAPLTAVRDMAAEVWPRLVRYTHFFGGRPLPPETRHIGAAQFAAVAAALDGMDPADPGGAEAVLRVVPSEWAPAAA